MSESNALGAKAPVTPLGEPPVIETPAPPGHPMLTPQHVSNLMHNNIAFLWNKTRGAPWREAALERAPEAGAEEHAIRAAHLRPVGHEVEGADHHGAYRRAAESISHREGKQHTADQVRSVMQEAGRRLFPDEHRATHPKTGEPTHPVGRYARDAWNAARYGLVMPAVARQLIYQRATQPAAQNNAAPSDTGGGTMETGQ